MNLLILSFSSVTIIMVIMMLTISVIGKKSMFDTQKSSPFECGFNPMSKKRMPFSIHFFMIAIIFLIFDIEIIIILPCIFTMKFTMIKYWGLTSMMFISILIMGLYYEWYNGMLTWSK